MDDTPDRKEGCVITGWGMVNVGNYLVPANTLQEAPTNMLTTSQCQIFWGPLVDDTQVCLWNQGKTGGCMGDSGGPVACRSTGDWVLVGLTSFGRPNCDPFFPSVYTRVASFREWVRDVTDL